MRGIHAEGRWHAGRTPPGRCCACAAHLVVCFVCSATFGSRSSRVTRRSTKSFASSACWARPMTRRGRASPNSQISSPSSQHGAVRANQLRGSSSVGQPCVRRRQAHAREHIWACQGRPWFPGAAKGFVPHARLPPLPLSLAYLVGAGAARVPRCSSCDAHPVCDLCATAPTARTLRHFQTLGPLVACFRNAHRNRAPQSGAACGEVAV